MPVVRDCVVQHSKIDRGWQSSVRLGLWAEFCGMLGSKSRASLAKSRSNHPPARRLVPILWSNCADLVRASLVGVLAVATISDRTTRMILTGPLPWVGFALSGVASCVNFRMIWHIRHVP